MHAVTSMRQRLSAVTTIFCLATVINTAHAAHAAPGHWQLLHPQSKLQEGEATRPAIRYGHTCAAYKGQLIVSNTWSTIWLQRQCTAKRCVPEV